MALVAVALWLVPGGVPASDPDDALATLSESDYAASITALDNGIAILDPGITQLDESIKPLETETSQGDETVITLSSDILFAFGEATISPNAEAKIQELVADVPEGATVQVHGHTDSVSGREFNHALSEERAETVAEIVREERTDLDLEVAGFGMDDPVEPNEKNGEDNPEGRALNRRVEIRYEG